MGGLIHIDHTDVIYRDTKVWFNTQRRKFAGDLVVVFDSFSLQYLHSIHSNTSILAGVRPVEVDMEYVLLEYRYSSPSHQLASIIESVVMGAYGKHEACADR